MSISLIEMVCVCVCRSLQLQAEWSQVVSDLIALCYRMSDVVSPVIQSSSPEGLIPMDTDSGSHFKCTLTLKHIKSVYMTYTAWPQKKSQFRLNKQILKSFSLDNYCRDYVSIILVFTN